MQFNCNAKINIGLEILNKRSDNYHNINTIFYRINLSDNLIIEPSDDFRFHFISGMNLPNEQNLAYKAAMSVKEAYSLNKLPLSITINKNIPAGAGLGGGSSDAAAVIRAVTKFLNLSSDDKRNFDIAKSLGSDVPFFLSEQNAAIGKGRGEILTEFKLNLPYWILLVFPGINVNTAEAYRMLKRTEKIVAETNYTDWIDILENNPELIRDVFVNHFEEPVFGLYPTLGEIKDIFLKNGALYASMSGSGSTIYGFFVSQPELDRAKSFLQAYQTYIHYPDSI